MRTSESGARYRLRLLFKSHLRQGNSIETHFACLWCVQAGTTARESDATIFRSPEDLLRHLARHPQPVPSISGVSVCYGPLPDSAPLDFDLHFPESPTPVPMPESVARLATAIAVKDHYRRPGRGKLEKPPKYEADMLEFMEGARIVGIIFPEKWGGKFGLGRHDGEFGAFPTKAIELRPPQETEIPVGGENGMSVTTRWKWQPGTGGAPWLSFGKGEVISNVQCEWIICYAVQQILKSTDGEQAFTQTTGVGLAPTARGKPGYSPSPISTCRLCGGRNRQPLRRAGGGVVCLAPGPTRGKAHQRAMRVIEIQSPHRIRYPREQSS